MNLQEAEPQYFLENYTYGDLKRDFTHFDLEYFMRFDEKQEEQSGGNSAGKKPTK